MKSQFTFIRSALLFFWVVISLHSYGVRRYVKPTASGTGNGSSWANATADVQAMILASSAGDTVWVAAGLYIPIKDGTGNASPANIRHKLFYMKSGVKLMGGFAGTETLISQRNLKNNKTIFSGDVDNNDLNTDGNHIAEVYTDIQGTNSYHIMFLLLCDKTTLIDGILFTAGQSGAPGDPTQQVDGFPLSTFFGSALNLSNSFPMIRNCVFSGNNGYNGTAYQTNGEGIDTVNIVSSYYQGNYAKFGSGIFFQRGHALINNVVIANNTGENGGAVYISSNVDSGKMIKFTNTTMVNNYSTTGKSVFMQNGAVSFINTIIWNSTAYSNGNVNQTGGILTSSYSLLQNSGAGGSWNSNYGTDGGNNYDLDPLLLNPADVNGADNLYFTADDGLRLTSCSPAINTGTSTNVLSLDLAANPRPYSAGISDIGAYEFQGAYTGPTNPTMISVSSTSVTCGQSVTLSGNCATGTLTWYTSYASMASIGTGTNLSHIPLDNPTTYYASCELSSTCVSIRRIATSAVAVTLPTAPTNVTVSSTGVCTNTQVTLSATCAAGSPQWLNGTTELFVGNSFMPTITAAITFSVKCKVSDCLSTAVSVPTINVLSSPQSVSQSTTSICAGQTVTLNASCTVGTVTWSLNPGGSSIGTGSPFQTIPASTGRYYVYCSNGSCISFSTSTSIVTVVAAPTSVNVSQTAVCEGTGVSLSGACTSGTLNWYDALTGGTSVGTGSPLTVTPGATVTYYAECTTGSCSTTRVGAPQVIVSANVTLPTNVSVNKAVVCPSTTVSLSATCATGAVTWYDQASGGAALGTGSPFAQAPTVTTTYYATCKNGACESTSVAAAQVVVSTVSSNLNLTAPISTTGVVHISSNTITATNKVLSTANAQYFANSIIMLNEGFEVSAGSVFLAKVTPITGCN